MSISVVKLQSPVEAQKLFVLELLILEANMYIVNQVLKHLNCYALFHICNLETGFSSLKSFSFDLS